MSVPRRFGHEIDWAVIRLRWWRLLAGVEADNGLGWQINDVLLDLGPQPRFEVLGAGRLGVTKPPVPVLPDQRLPVVLVVPEDRCRHRVVLPCQVVLLVEPPDLLRQVRPVHWVWY